MNKIIYDKLISYTRKPENMHKYAMNPYMHKVVDLFANADSFENELELCVNSIMVLCEELNKFSRLMPRCDECKVQLEEVLERKQDAVNGITYLRYFKCPKCGTPYNIDISTHKIIRNIKIETSFGNLFQGEKGEIHINQYDFEKPSENWRRSNQVSCGMYKLIPKKSGGTKKSKSFVRVYGAGHQYDLVVETMEEFKRQLNSGKITEDDIKSKSILFYKLRDILKMSY